MASLLDAFDTILAENPSPPIATLTTQHFADNNRDPTATNPSSAASSIAATPGAGVTSPLGTTPATGGDLLTFPSPPNGDAVANMFADSYGSDLLNDHGGSLEENNCLSNGHDQDCKICQ